MQRIVMREWRRERAVSTLRLHAGQCGARRFVNRAPTSSMLRRRRRPRRKA